MTKVFIDDIEYVPKGEVITPPVTPPIPPTPPTPLPITPPAPPMPPPNGFPWVWDAYPTFDLSPGDERVYIVNINKNYTYLKMSISGLTMNTMGTFTWTFPDGRVLPVDGQRQGEKKIVGMNGAGLLVLRAGNNISDNPIPHGNHVLRVSASGELGNYFKISIEAE